LTFFFLFELIFYVKVKSELNIDLLDYKDLD